MIPLQAKFSDLETLVPKTLKTTGQCLDAIFFDIGISTNQLNDPDRGFSFRSNGPLDMRMNSKGNLESTSDRQPTAESIVNNYPVGVIADILWKYGEERQAKKIALAIDDARCRYPILSTKTLSDIICKSMGITYQIKGKAHPATKTFQAYF